VDVAENAFETALPRAAVGTPVGVTFGDSSCRTGATPVQLRQAVPALTLQSHGDSLPIPVVGQLIRDRGVATADARLVTRSQQMRFWIVPAGAKRCADGRVAGTVDSACALAATAQQLFGVACAGVRDIARGSLTFADQGGGDIVVVGLAPPGTDAAIISTPRGIAVIPATDGVVGGFLPPGVTLRDTARVKVTYRPTGKPGADAQAVAVIDASGVAGRDKAVADRLAQLARGTSVEGEVLHGIATLDPRAKSAVEFAPNGVDKARKVAGMLGIRSLRPLEQGVPTSGAAIVVIVGRDFRIPFSVSSVG
jgi:LytR cell envelope-related transcriptional attenuator